MSNMYLRSNWNSTAPFKLLAKLCVKVFVSSKTNCAQVSMENAAKGGVSLPCNFYGDPLRP